MAIASINPATGETLRTFEPLQKLPPVTAEMLAVYEAARSWKPSAAALR